MPSLLAISVMGLKVVEGLIDELEAMDKVS